MAIPTGHFPVWQKRQYPAGTPDFLFEIALGDLLVAVKRDKGANPNGHGICAKGQRLCRIGAAAYATRCDQADLAVEPKLAQGLTRHNYSRNRGNAAVLQQHLCRCTGAGQHAVDDDGIGPGLGCQLHIVVHTTGPEFHVNRNSPVGGLAQLLDLDGEVIRAKPVRMAGRTALVYAQGQVPHFGHIVLYLHAHQHPARSWFGALAHHYLNSLGTHQVVRVESVPAGKYLVNEFVGYRSFSRQHATVAGAARGAHHGGGLAQRDLGIGRKRTVAHAADVHRRFQHQWILGVEGAYDGACVAPLFVTLQGKARQSGGQKCQVIEVGYLLERRKTANAVATQLSLGVNIVHDPGRPDLAAAHYHISVTFP